MVVAGIGTGWELRRYGRNDGAAAARLESEVRARVRAASVRVETLAARVADRGREIAAAAASDDALPALFGDISNLASSVGADAASVTVYVPAPPAGQYRVLAWSDGPAESILPERLAGSAGVFVAPGSAGLRLVAIAPVTTTGRHVGVAAAEAVIAAMRPAENGGLPRLDTSFGPVTLIARYAGAGEATPTPNSFVISGSSGAPLLEVQFAPEDLTRGRRQFTARVVAAAAIPLVVGLLVLAASTLAARGTAQSQAIWLGWSGAAALFTTSAAVLLAWLSTLVGAPAELVTFIAGAALMAVVVIFGGTWWWRSARGKDAASARLWFFGEQICGGLLLLAVIVVLRRFLAHEITPLTLEKWQYVVFPFDFAGVLSLGARLLVELSLLWGLVAALALLSTRWRLLRSPAAAAVAVICWCTPVAIASAMTDGTAALGVVLLAVTFGISAARWRRTYRHATQSMRLVLGFAALLVPLVAAYPLTAMQADVTRQEVIEHQYAPATADHPDELRAQLFEAQADIDGQSAQLVASLRDVGTPGVIDSQKSFLVWNQTRLSRTRVTSDVELYGADRSLVSRFALNLPEYRSDSTQRWQGEGCSWKVVGEVTRFAAQDRPMLHADRGLCDESGHLVGAIVVHVARTDYQALPFVSSASPYYDIFGPAGGAVQTRLPNLQVVVYGWSGRPIFMSDDVAWAIPEALFTRLYSAGTPFWNVLDADGQKYRVYLSQNRTAVYALGYPVPNVFDHATHLAEVAAVVAVVFVLMQLGGVAYAPLARHGRSPLQRLLLEIRTSFYRKLFLGFVLVAIVPVMLLAFAFGAYMTAKFRADIEHEAKDVVTVARRVFSEVASTDARPGEPQALQTDDLMVWIRQVVDQDVNLFDGPDLIATSQRDLFDSGLLPTRTPASAYRAIALDRLPTFVAEDRPVGSLRYLVAAAPVSIRGHETVLTVPLALRQREIEQQIDELYRRVLVGAVLVVLFAGALGASLASRVADPVARLTKATRQIAAGNLNVRIAADTADELRRLVDDFNSMAATLLSQRAALARTNQLKAWNEMARQVAHEIKNPLTPIQLAAEHLARVHADRGRPLGAVFDQCVTTVLGQVRLLRQIASEFANFAGQPTARPERIELAELMEEIVGPYRLGLAGRVDVQFDLPPHLPAVWVDRTLLSRALSNLIENAVQAMPGAGGLHVSAHAAGATVVLQIADSGVGMDAIALERAFEPYFSTKTSGSGLGLANARRNIEIVGGSVTLESAPGRGTTATVTLPMAVGPAVSS